LDFCPPPEITVAEIAGHSDSNGGHASNVQLSESRANMIRAYLLGRGIVGSRLVVRACGSTEPIASNDTPTGRETNRRVELRIGSWTPANQTVVLHKR